MRTYAGAITGGKGPGSGDTGQPYRFTPAVSPFTAIGATAALEFGVVNQVAAATKNDLSEVHTVPDPYYVKSAYEASTDQKVLKFVGLPEKAIIRIYSVSGVLVRMLEHDGNRYAPTSPSQGSELTGTSAIATTRWSPAGCTSITSKPATRAESAASRS